MRRTLFSGVEITGALGLRTTTLKSELAQLPNELEKLLNLISEARLNHNSNQYRLVLIWIKLSQYERYWDSFGYSAEFEFLAAFGLPDGHTLALWRVLVELFDETTFCVAGPETLGAMQRKIGDKVSDVNERKRHYAKVFEAYSAQFRVFNRNDFHNVLNGYMEREFPAPREKLFTPQGSRRRTITGSRRINLHTSVDDSQVFPPVTRDFTLVKTECPRCKVAEQLFQEYEAYTERLESIILSKLGKRALPPRPQKLGRRRES